MNERNRIVKRCVVTCGAACVAAAAAQTAAADDACEPHWEQTSWTQGLGVRSMAVFDDGTGEALYIGGYFSAVSGVPANNVAKWDGSSWSALGSGIQGPVQSFAVYDDGTGPALYATGLETVMKWSDGAWHQIGHFIAGFEFADLWAMAVLDNDLAAGGGSSLYVGGAFTTINFSIFSNGVARWDGKQWSDVPNSGNYIHVLAAYQGPGDEAPLLHAGSGDVRRWDGTSWTSLGLNGSVRALTVAQQSIEDGDGSVLYAGGWFTSAQGMPVNGIARWDGSAWSPLGEGVSSSTHPARVHALSVFDDGSGPALYAAGLFDTAGGVAANNIARWNGSAWAPLGNGLHFDGDQWDTPVEALQPFTSDAGDRLYAGGRFGGGIVHWQGCPAPNIPGDLNGDGVVDVSDLLILLAAWGPCAGVGGCTGDLDGNGVVDVSDMLILLANWS